MSESVMKAAKAKMVDYSYGWSSQTRVPVAFEVGPGLVISHKSIAGFMNMPEVEVKRACELMVHHGHGTFSSEWSMNRST